MNCPGSLSVIDPGDVAVIEAAETRNTGKIPIEIKTVEITQAYTQIRKQRNIASQARSSLGSSVQARWLFAGMPLQYCKNKPFNEAIIAWRTADISVKNSVLSIVDDEIV